jgi:hypothetical protein
VQQSFGLLVVTIPYSYVRNGVYYQRAVPSDLRDRYPTQNVKVKLTTQSLRIAARQIAAINRQVEAEWQRARADPKTSTSDTRERALALLAQWDLSPEHPNDDDKEGLFFEYLDGKRERLAGGNEGPMPE